MYDGRRSRVKEVESVEYLRAPTTHDLDVDFLESTKVSKKIVVIIGESVVALLTFLEFLTSLVQLRE